MPAWHWDTIEGWARATGRLPGLREEILGLLERTSSPASPLAAQLIAAGYAKSVGQVWQALNDLMDEGLVGRSMPDTWLITETGRTALTRRGVVVPSTRSQPA
jgi:DNA-binding GntR family transcriptional regulator